MGGRGIEILWPDKSEVRFVIVFTAQRRIMSFPRVEMMTMQ